MEATQKSKALETPTETSEQQQELDQESMLEMLNQNRRIKSTLKQLSKNQLIKLLVEQVNLAVEQQNINKVLLEKLKEQE